MVYLISPMNIAIEVPSLSPSATSQLVVDTTGLMAGGAQDVQPTGLRCQEPVRDEGLFPVGFV